MPSGPIPDSSRPDVTRRDVLSKGAKLSAGVALVGWSRPQISSLVLSQAATTPRVETNISFIALLLNCGGQQFRIKFEENQETGEFNQVECGPDFGTPGCGDFHQNSPSVAEGCPQGVTSTLNEDGTVTINLGNCIVQDFAVKCGHDCFGPNEGGQPPAGATGSITFQQCP